MKNRNKLRGITYAGIVAAIYVVLTCVANLFGLSGGAVQCRLSEALCVLPAFTPFAIPGLFIGCIISNLITGCVIFDIIFGSLATLVGAVGTYCFAKLGANKFTLPLPPILANTLIIPFVLYYCYSSVDASVAYYFVSVFVGESVSCGVLGMFIYSSLKKHTHILFK